MPGKIKILIAGFKICLFWLLAGQASALADAGDWKLTRTEGVVRVMLPGQAITRGREAMSLPQGTVITTGRSSAATLSRAGQQIDMAEDTRLTVAQSGRQMTVIRQETGSAYYQVDKQSMPHFRVDTSLLAAVVKGTGFTVVAGGGSDRVIVSEGVVEVESLSSGRSVELGAGEGAVIDSQSPGEIEVQSPGQDERDPEAANDGQGQVSAPQARPEPEKVKPVSKQGGSGSLMPSPQVMATLILLGLGVIIGSAAAIWARRKR